MSIKKHTSIKKKSIKITSIKNTLIEREQWYMLQHTNLYCTHFPYFKPPFYFLLLIF